MKTSALRSLARVLDIGKLRVSVPVFLAPTAARFAPWGCPKQWTMRVRKYATLATNTPLPQRDNFPVNSDPDYMSMLSSSLRRRDPKAWADLLDQYLPHELRLDTNKLAGQTYDVESLRPIQSLPRLLFCARTTKPLKLDLLSYVGVVQGRWKAVLWLVKAMLDQCLHSKTSLDWNTLDITQDTPWLMNDYTMDELTSQPIRAEECLDSSDRGLTLDELTHANPSEHWRVAEYMKREGFGQLWQSVGCMILQAADRPNDDETFKSIMFNVFQILGHLHHINALPRTIYNYTQAEDPSVLRRPPTLNLLSSRIMTILSDCAWKVLEREVSSKTSLSGATQTNSSYDLPIASLQPRIRELGPEVWLDLVLWSCVEGGWIMEGAWIVGEMMRRKGDQRWSAMNWSALNKPSVPNNAWSSVKSEIERSRINQMGRGISIAGRPGGPTVLDTNPRTVSSEVIVALTDGLVSTARRTFGLHGNSPAEIQQYLNACKNLLERKHFALDTNSWNAIILRLVESGGFSPEAEPKLLEFIINLTPSYLKEAEPLGIDQSPSSSAQGYAANQTTANLGLLHRNLNAFSDHGDVQGALRTFRKLQALVDANRSRAIQGLALDLGHQEFVEASTDATRTDLDGVPGVHPSIPTNVLARFLDLVTEAKAFDFGRWLIYSDEVDGPTIPPEMYSDKNLQPALLRFATATASASLLGKITKKLETPLSEDILRALMHCQVVVRKWDAVGDVLAYFQQEGGMKWNATDVMVIARTIMRIENGKHTNSFEKATSISKAHVLFQTLLEGKYNSARDQSQQADLSQIQMMNQLREILQTVPGSLSEVAAAVSPPSRFSAGCGVPCRAFNILLEGVVENYGCIAGRRLWDQWCGNISSDAHRKPLPQISGSEKVVVPNLHMLRTIMDPIAQARYNAGNEESSSTKSASSSVEGLSRLSLEEEKDICRWGVGMYRKFGLTNKEISMELPGVLSQREPEEDS